MNLLRTALILTFALSSAACGIDTLNDLFTSPTEPTNNGEVRSYLGTWAGPTLAPAAQSCGSLMWKITSQTGNQASGDFSATCGDDVKLTGTMTATHGDTSIPWAVTAIKHGYEDNRRILIEGLPKAGLTKFLPVDGAFYLYADISEFSNDSFDFAKRLLEDVHVAATPGVDFDPIHGRHFVRFSYAGSTADMKEAVERIGRWLRKR